MNNENKVYKSNINLAEWVMVLVVLGFIDIVQIILNFFLIGVILNRIIDIVVGGFFILYLLLRGELRNEETRNRITLAFFATFIIEMIPAVDVAPMWFLDGLYCMFQSSQMNQKASKEEEKGKTKNSKTYQKDMILQQKILALRQKQEQERIQRQNEYNNNNEQTDE